MKERRKFLQVVPLAALGATTFALTATSDSASAKKTKDAGKGQSFDPRKQRSVPDVAGVTHTGRSVRFYQDLVKDKVVAINFMSIRSEERFPVTSRMAEIARRLGDKLGRDVFLISVTRDTEHDTPERLAEFAEKYDAPEGWVFVNCAADGTTALQSRVYHPHEHGAAPAHHEAAALPNSVRSTDTIFYGNGGVGLWSNVPVDIHPDEVIRHISWVMPGEKPVGEARRAGPRVLNSTGRASDNRIA
ncbi:MAG: SCO family protein [Acidobacteria bacterium]|nr:SCO family protein [Acidobacteriota bacterium]